MTAAVRRDGPLVVRLAPFYLEHGPCGPLPPGIDLDVSRIATLPERE